MEERDDLAAVEVDHVLGLHELGLLLGWEVVV